MPYELDDNNEPPEASTSDQPMKPATPETERRAAGDVLDIGQPVKIVRVRNQNEKNWIGIIGRVSDRGTGIYMVETDGPELARRKVPFYRDELEPTDLTPEIQAIMVVSGTTRYISLLTSTCRVCGYVESLDLQEEATLEDIIAAVRDMLSMPCPICEEAITPQEPLED